jgi:hypothetical protein
MGLEQNSKLRILLEFIILLVCELRRQEEERIRREEEEARRRREKREVLLLRQEEERGGEGEGRERTQGTTGKSAAGVRGGGREAIER